MEVKVGVHYREKLEVVEKITLEAIRNSVDFNERRPLELYFTDFGDSSINLIVRFWIKKVRQADFYKAKSDAIKAIRNAYRDHNITIPFPIRTIEMERGN